MADLLPCPFCGSTNLRYEFAGSQGYIECNECGTEGPCDERAADPYCDDDAACDAWNRRAAALAEEPAVPQPQPPAEGEVAELVAWLRDQDGWMGTRVIYSRIAELLQRLSPPQPPVPVSERLPGPEDCDAKGRCWWGRNESDDWSADWTLATHEAVAEFCEFCPRTVWLPAHALPLPGQEVEG